ncbi:hypothetical protein HGA34_05705 [Candidatus Falkowbacteria bacterium]|nr:hypothetical protein [Candidatus Falkowbacteria bacterium]
MEKRVIEPLTQFLEEEKKIAETQLLQLVEERNHLRGRRGFWQAEFDKCSQKAKLIELPKLIYLFFRLESAKSRLEQTESYLIPYFAKAQELSSQSLDEIADQNYATALEALEHIGRNRPIANHQFDDDYPTSTLSNPRYVANYFLEQLRESLKSCQTA